MKIVGEFFISLIETDNLANIDEKIMHCIRNWSEIKINSNQNIKDILKFDHTSLWWFFNSRLHFETRLIITTRNNKRIQKRDIKFILPSFFGRNYILIKVIVRFLFGKLCNLRYKRSSSSNPIIFTGYAHYWRNFTHTSSKNINNDIMFGDIFKKMEEFDYDVLALDIDSTFLIDFSTLLEKMFFTKGLWRPIESYLTLNLIKNVYKLCDGYDTNWKKLKYDSAFIDSLQCDGTPLNSLEQYFDMFFKYDVFQAVLYIELMKRAIEITKAKAIVVMCEYCIFGKAAIIAGKIQGVPTIAIQHGIITPTHSGYIFNKEDKDEIILPDITCVYGQYHHDLLTKDSIYEPEQVIVTGQPRYDILHHIDKIYSKKRFLEKYEITPEHKLVLWTTQSHGLSDEENTKNLMAMFKATQNLKNTTLIIKQHPGERKKHTQKIKQYLTNYKINAVMVPKSSNIYEQIFVCDLLITKHSTTAMEAVALNKPVIVLSLIDSTDYAGYVEEGIARGVYKEEDLTTTIEELLQDDSYLAKNRDKYINKYMDNIDGKASERVVDIIDKTVQSNMDDNNLIFRR